MSFIKRIVVKLVYGLKNMHYKLLRFCSKWAYRYKVRKHYFPNSNISSVTDEYMKAVKKYWKQYTKDFDAAYHKFYIGISGKFDVRYIPDDLYVSKIDPYFNDRDMHIGVCDKNYFNVWFSNVRMPETVCRKINGIWYDAEYKLIDETKVVQLLKNAGRFVAKPALNSCGGDNVKFFSNPSNNEITNILKDLPSREMIFQKAIVQHSQLSEIHKESVNSLRIMTLLFKGKVHCIQSILRMGVGTSKVDNAMSGGVFCGVNPDSGTLKKYAYNQQGKRFDKHPDGFELEGFEIPGYKAAVEMVMAEAEKLAHFRLISWDVAIDENAQPVLIEANLQMGDADIVQIPNGPLFGDLTDEVLAEVFGK